MLEEFPDKPKGMHWRTYERWRRVHDVAEERSTYRAVVEALVAEHGPQGPTSPCFVGSALSLTRGIP
jgi:hypothetical protein